MERRIREELDEQPQFIQLSLFSPLQQEQYNRNVAAFRAGLRKSRGSWNTNFKAIRTATKWYSRAFSQWP